MDKIAMTKAALRFLARGGTSAAVTNVVVNSRSRSNNEAVDTYYKTSAYVGGIAAGWMIGDIVGDFTEKAVDEAVAWFNENFKK